MIRIREIALPPEHSVAQLSFEAAQALRISVSKIRRLTIVRRSVDARKKPDVKIVYTVDVAVDGNENKILKQFGCKRASIAPVSYYKVPKPKGLPKHRPVVVGFGPAGMFAAITAASRGQKVLLIERNDRLGKKLLITGKGRCNVTNNCSAQEVMQNTPRNGKFLFSALENCPPAKVMDFFENNGCSLKTERGNRVFPVSDKSQSILECLKNALHKNQVKIQIAKVLEILTENSVVTGVKTDAGIVSASKVILATGGLSYPTTGSTGDGYRMAKALGHTVVETEGSLVPLETAGNICQKIMF